MMNKIAHPFMGQLSQGESWKTMGCPKPKHSHRHWIHKPQVFWEKGQHYLEAEFENLGFEFRISQKLVLFYFQFKLKDGVDWTE